MKTTNMINFRLFLILALFIIAFPQDVYSSSSRKFEKHLDILRDSHNNIPPDIEFFDGRKKRVKLSDFKGKLIMLNFWATWCGSCVKEKPSLDRLQKRYRTEKLHIISLSQDFRGIPKVKKFYRNKGIQNLEPYADIKNALFKKMRIGSIPTTIFISPEGKILARTDGFVNWDKKSARDFVEGLL